MAKRPIIEQWERSRMFGESVIRGYVDGERRWALFRYSSNNRVGVSWGSLGQEAIWALGEPSPHWFEGAKCTR